MPIRPTQPPTFDCTWAPSRTATSPGVGVCRCVAVAPGTSTWHHTARQVAHGVAREPPGVRDERRSLPPLPARVHRVGEAVQVEYHGPRRALLVAHDDRKPSTCCRGPELGVAASPCLPLDFNVLG